jgi:hypothetical protein
MKKLIVLSLLFSSLLSCEKSDPSLQNEEELITTVKYTLSPSTGGTAVQLVFKDLDGDGGAAPTVTGGTLKVNTSYKGSLELLNESGTKSVNIGDEVLAEALEHQLFYSSTLSDIKISYDDKDSKAQPIGLKTTLQTGNKANGKLKITLRHEPNKAASGVASGDIKNAGGETDIEVEFPITVQ